MLYKLYFGGGGGGGDWGGGGAMMHLSSWYFLITSLWDRWGAGTVHFKVVVCINVGQGGHR